MEVYIDNFRSGKSHKKCNPYSECKCSESVNFPLSCFQISGHFFLKKILLLKILINVTLEHKSSHK